MLEVKLLGLFDARRDGAPLAIPSRAAQSLLAYLILSAGTPHRRERLAGLLWPNTLEESARHNLRHELWRIRKAIEIGPPGDQEEAYLLADEFSIAFNANAEYWLDVSILERTRTEGASANDLMTMLALYRGDLLPGFYDEWVILERERLHAIFEQKMAHLLECLVEEKRWKEILEWGERWIALGRTPEPAYRALMIAHSEMGDKSKVASAYQRCIESLRKDLGVEPSEQTHALFERLRVGAKTSKEKISPLLPTALAPLPQRSVALPLSDEPPAPGEPPFKGLEYFDEGDADLFFGRELLTAKLAAHLPQDRFLAIVGASGSGKSSIVRAGLVPALKQKNAQWQYHVITPTAQPLEALAATLTRDAESIAATTTLCDDLARDPRCLRLAIQRALERGGTSHLLLVVDQFEELFTLCRDEFEREAFIDNLLIASAPETDTQVSVVVTLRADFYAHGGQYPDLREALAQHQEYIGPMSAEELRRAIEAPARHGGWEFEQGLVDLILRDVGDEPGALPLLSHALLETWKRRRGRTLTLKGYAESGGVRGAIAKTAETVFHQLTLEQQQIARSIFLRLTELGEGTQDTRRRATISELISRPEDTPVVQSVINKLADARLITTGEGTAEVAHEALIREWHTLREWLNENREGLRLHRHLTESAQAWQKLNRESGELYRGARLAQSLDWASENAGELNPLEREFLDASRAALAREEAERDAQRQRELQAAQKLAEAERQRAETQAAANRKLRQRAVFLAGTLLVALILAVAAIWFAQQSNQNAQTAIAQKGIAETERLKAEDERRIAFTRELSVNAVNNLETDPERSILLALQAVSVSSAGGKPVLLEAEEALHRAVNSSRVQFTIRGLVGYAVAYSPDGTRIATAAADVDYKTGKVAGGAKIWDVTTGKELLTFTGHTWTVGDIAFSPDGKKLATASGDKTAKVWDATTGKELLTLAGHTFQVTGVAFSPDGTRIATSAGLQGSTDHTAKVWDATTGKELLTLVGHTAGVDAIAYSPDGKRIATGGYDNVAKVWDAITGKELLTLTGHTYYIESVAFSPDGKRLATSGMPGDGTIKIWDSNSGQLLMNLVHDLGARSIAFDSTGTRLVAGGTDGKAKVWDTSSGKILMSLAGHNGGIWRVALSPHGTHLATASDDTTVKIWDISPAGNREWMNLPGQSGNAYMDVTYSPDGARIAAASTDKTAKIWDAQTGKLLLTLTGHTNEVKGIAFSPDGKRLVTKSSDLTIKVWDMATGKVLLNIPNQFNYSGIANRVTFSPDGQRIASSGSKGSLKVWDAATGKELFSNPALNELYTLHSVRFSPDGQRIATTNMPPKLWDIVTGQLLLSFGQPTGGIPYDLAFSPDGKRLAVGSSDGIARVFDTATGQELHTLSGHTSLIGSVAFSPDGTRLATSSTDGTTKVWNVSAEGQRNEQPLTLYGAWGLAVTFSPDGKRLVISGRDDALHIYALPLDDIIAIAKSRVTRALTNDECQKFLHVEQCPSQP